MSRSHSRKRVFALRMARAFGVGLILLMILRWMIVSSMPTTPIIYAGDATLDAAIGAIAQRTAQAQETQSFERTLTTQRNASATAVRQQTLDKIADDTLHAQQTATQKAADALLTQQAVQASQTQTAATHAAATASVQAVQTQTAQARTRAADEAHATETRRANDATATAVARQQDQEDFDHKIHAAGLMLGFVALAIVVGMILFALGVLAYRLSRKPVDSTSPAMEPGTQVVVIPLPAPRIVDDPAAVAEITRALQEQQEGHHATVSILGDDTRTIDVTPKSIS